MIELTLIGNLGQDPESKQDKNGDEFTVLSVAVNRGFYDKDSGKWVEQDPIWVSVLCFGYVSDKAQKLRKGLPVFVRGVPSVNVWYSEEKDMAMGNQVCVAKILRGFGANEEESSSRRRTRRRSRNQDNYDPDDYTNPL